MRHEEVTDQVRGAAIEVHRHLGPGLLESTYRLCLAYGRVLRDLSIRQEVPPNLVYKDLAVIGGYRLDLMVSECVVAEVKAIDKVLPVHKAQLLRYLRLSGQTAGLLLNFNVPVLRQGIMGGCPEPAAAPPVVFRTPEGHSVDLRENPQWISVIRRRTARANTGPSFSTIPPTARSCTSASKRCLPCSADRDPSQFASLWCASRRFLARYSDPPPRSRPALDPPPPGRIS